jgi:hypothetical protein
VRGCSPRLSYDLTLMFIPIYPSINYKNANKSIR